MLFVDFDFLPSSDLEHIMLSAKRINEDIWLLCRNISNKVDE